MSVDDPKSKQLNLTDMGNAERLTLYHGRDVRYCHEWGKWIAWDGRKWTIDESGAIHSRAKSTVRKIYEEAAAVSASAANEKTVDQRKELATLGEKTLSWAKSSESLHRVNAMVQLAKSGAGMPISPSELDADPWLLNCVNGTVNLRTGEMLPHSRENLATKLAPVKYDPDAEAPVFKQFLSQIMGGDKQLITFLQKAFGYALTGDVSEQVLFILYGTGANGKSTLLNTLLGMSGDYSMKAASGLLMAKRSDSHPTERADLFKMRLVAAHESDQGHGLNEAFVKEATGGDPIRARRMSQDFWEFYPSHTIFLATNHKPEIRGTDNGIWRRMRLIPFDVTIPEALQDMDLPDKLKAEWPGILNWVVQGCLLWRRDGLGVPATVVAANQAYRSDMDTLAPFLDDCCVLGLEQEVRSRDLYATYSVWCSQNGEKELSQRELTSRLLDRGDITKKRLGHGGDRGLKGVGLISERQDDPWASVLGASALAGTDTW